MIAVIALVRLSASHWRKRSAVGLVAVHEPALCEAHPPLARLPCSICVQSFDKPCRQLLTYLDEVVAEEV